MIGLRSGLCRTFTFFVVESLLCCFGLGILYCWMDRFLQSFRYLANKQIVFQIVSLYTAPSICPSIVIRCPVLSEEKHPHNMMLLPPDTMIGMVCGWMDSAQHILCFEFWPKYFCLIRPQNLIPYFLANSRQNFAWMRYFFNNGFPSSHLYKPVVSRTLDIVDCCTCTPVSAIEFWTPWKWLLAYLTTFPPTGNRLCSC